MDGQDEEFLTLLRESPRPEFVRQLAARLDLIDAPRTMQAPSRSRWFLGAWPHWTPAFKPLALASGLVVAAMVLFTMSWLSPTTQVSASEILAKAEQATSPSTLHSYHGTLIERARGTLLGSFTQTQQERWFQAPDSYRTDVHARTSDGREDTMSMVTDGVTFWNYQSQTGQVTLMDSRMVRAGANPAAFGAADLQTLLREASRDVYKASLVGNEQVAGRAAYVVDVTPKPGAAVPSNAAHLKLRIDQATFFPLGSEVWDNHDNLLDSQVFTSIELNSSLDPTLFAFSPPPGAQVLDAHPATGEKLAQLWRQAAQQAPYTIFMPTDIPAKIVPGKPSYDNARRVITQSYIPPERNQLWVKLILLEGSPSVLQGGDGGQIVQVGALSARYVDNDGMRTLTLDRDGTRILLQTSGALSKDDLVQVAQSLQPVSTTP